MGTSGRILFLHGASSAGKSTLARALQDSLPIPFWHISIDHLRDHGSLPMHRVGQDFAWSELRTTVFDGFHASITAYAEAGNNLIVEHILEDAKMRVAVRTRLAGFDVTWIGLHTGLATLKAREGARGDRRIGSAAEDFDRIHIGMTYDLELNGSHPVDENVARVRAHIGL